MHETSTHRDAELAELRTENERLRRLLDAPTEARPSQRSSLAMLRMLVRRSAETAEDLEDYVRHLEDRLDAIARAQAAIDILGLPGLGSLIANELMAYTISEGGQATLTGPIVRLKPRAAQVFALAIHELTVNAVEHGVLLRAGGALDVRWTVEDGGGAPTLVLAWKETGFTDLSRPGRAGFGTEVLTGMVAAELKAATDLAYEPDGLRCAIRFPLPERIGRLCEDDGLM